MFKLKKFTLTGILDQEVDELLYSSDKFSKLTEYLECSGDSLTSSFLNKQVVVKLMSDTQNFPFYMEDNVYYDIDDNIVSLELLGIGFTIEEALLDLSNKLDGIDCDDLIYHHTIVKLNKVFTQDLMLLKC